MLYRRLQANTRVLEVDLTASADPVAVVDLTASDNEDRNSQYDDINVSTCKCICQCHSVSIP